jgi:arsenite methyltransferase
VLRPGGRLSIFEPINSFGFPEPDDRFWGFDVTPVADLKRKLSEAYRRHAGDATLVDFDERDLLEFADRAGFRETRLDYEATLAHGGQAPWGNELRSWDVFLNTAPNPLAPSLAEAIDEALTPEEAERFLRHLRPLYDARATTGRFAVAYLRAVK